MINRASPKWRRHIILPIVLTIIGGLVIVSRSPPASSQPAPADDNPESCISRLLAAERTGDTRAYLACFSGPQQAKFIALWRSQTDRQTVTELRDRSAGLVGHALSGRESTSPDRASLVLERIEKDHTARQRVELQRIDGRWLITRLATADWRRPSIPYGTPVFTPQRDAAP